MNIHIRTCVQSLHHQNHTFDLRRSHHWSLVAPVMSYSSQIKFASSIFAGRRRRESFCTRITV